MVVERKRRWARCQRMPINVSPTPLCNFVVVQALWKTHYRYLRDSGYRVSSCVGAVLVRVLDGVSTMIMVRISLARVFWRVREFSGIEFCSGS